MERRPELMKEKHDLPSRYWEPEPEEPDEGVPAPEAEDAEEIFDDDLPFV